MIENRMFRCKSLVELNEAIKNRNIFNYTFMPVFMSNTDVISEYNLFVNSDVSLNPNGDNVSYEFKCKLLDDLDSLEHFLNKHIEDNRRLVRVESQTYEKQYQEIIRKGKPRTDDGRYLVQVMDKNIQKRVVMLEPVENSKYSYEVEKKISTITKEIYIVTWLEIINK